MIRARPGQLLTCHLASVRTIIAGVIVRPPSARGGGARADATEGKRVEEKRIVVWVQQFKDRGSLMLQWIDPDTGKRKSKSAKTDDPDKAEQKRADLEYELNNGKYQEVSRMSWERFREQFGEEFVAGRRANTRRNYRVALDLFEKVCKPTTLRGITERTISAFAAGLRKLPGHGGGTMQASSIKVRLQFLHTALKWAADQKLVPACPRFPAVKVPKKRPQPVPAEAFEKLLAKAPDDQMRAFLLCGWLAGLRLNEALALEWRETDKAPYLDPDRNRIVFPAAVVKADEDQWVPLDPELWQALTRLTGRAGRVFRFDAVDGRGDRRVTDITMSARVRKIAQAAGVRLTFKSLRRGFGCRYAGKVSAQVLQKLMRHSSIKVTMDYYANVDDAAMEAVLGPQRNRLRNTLTPAVEEPARCDDGKNCAESTSD
jgi:integrase